MRKKTSNQWRILCLKKMKCKRKALAIELNTVSEIQENWCEIFGRLFFSFFVRSKINSMGVWVNFIKGFFNLFNKNGRRRGGFKTKEFNDKLF
jgi:hypothetical protein